MTTPAGWIGRAIDPVRKVGRAVAKSWGQDPDDGEGIALLSLCRLACEGQEWDSEDHFRGTAVVAGRRAVGRVCKRERTRAAKRVPHPLETVPAPEPGDNAEPLPRLSQEDVESVLERFGMNGVLFHSVMLDGRSTEETAARYCVSVRTVQKAVKVVCDHLRATLPGPAE